MLVVEIVGHIPKSGGSAENEPSCNHLYHLNLFSALVPHGTVLQMP